MKLSDIFVDCATSAGRNNLIKGTPSQDYASVYRSKRFLLTIVADGVGSGKYSHLGAKLWTDTILVALDEHQDQLEALNGSRSTRKAFECINTYLSRSTDTAIENMKDLLRMLTIDSLDKTEQFEYVKQTLMASVRGIIVTPRYTFMFGAGDGVWCVNGKSHEIKQGDLPKVLGYNLLASLKPEEGYPTFSLSLGDGSQECRSWEYCIEEHMLLPTQQLSAFLVGTDGAAVLIEGEEKTLTKPDANPDVPYPSNAGPLTQFMDSYYRRTHALQMRLNVLVKNNDNPMSSKNGETTLKMFYDDVSLAVVFGAKER